VMNLIVNASEAMGDESGAITVATGVIESDDAGLSEARLIGHLPEGRCVFLEVKDTGCGLKAEDRQRIFEPFLTTKFLGRGLGLAAVQGIVRSHGGAILVDSAPGKGAALKVLFAARDEAAEPGEAVATGERRVWDGGGTILLIDDEESVRITVTRMLERAGFDVLSVGDAHEGVAMFREHAGVLVCVLLDLTMPSMGGEETFEAMRRIDPSVPVILCSGYNEEEVLNRFSGRGFAGFIHKPYRSEGLAAKIAEVLGKPEEPAG